LPPRSLVCQFCGADTSKVERPKEVKRQSEGYVASKAVWVWYTIISIWWAVSGAVSMFYGLSEGFAFGVILGAFHFAIGLGMLARIRLFRGIANVLCFVSLLKGLCYIVGGLLGTTLFGPAAFVSCLIGVVDVVTSGGMIYVIGETESHLRS
jgi:hypothetical protein